jgi:hypothetical protein
MVGGIELIDSARVGNRYGNSQQQALGMSADVGAAVLRADKLRRIEVITDGEQMWSEAKP